MRFAPADGILPPQTSDSVLGLRFNIEARYGGVVEVDLTDLQPRALAVAFAGALRRQAGLGGSLGAASTIKQHMQGYRRFFAYLRKHSSAATAADLRAEDIDGFETFLEAGGMTPIHRHIVLAKTILALRSIDADSQGLLHEDLCRRLIYTSAQSAGRSRPRDAYSPFVARQLRDAARADIGKIFRRIGRPLDEAGTITSGVPSRTSKPRSRRMVELPAEILPSRRFTSCAYDAGLRLPVHATTCMLVTICMHSMFRRCSPFYRWRLALRSSAARA